MMKECAELNGISRLHEEDVEGLWNVRQTAQALGVSQSLVYRMAESGELPRLKIHNLIRFVPADVRRWIVAQATA